ncbi:MAG: SGNH/GDSL hydrolase family protein [Bdellovibrio sp.]|nr:SGNH/GDSL hydrolase family protein [Bdellovibrio sp.]
MKVLLVLFIVLITSAFGREDKKRILIVGDSHTAQSYGTMIHAHFSYDGNTVATYGSCGSSPLGWFSSAAWATTKCGHFEVHPSGKAMRASVMKTPSFIALLKNISHEFITPTPPDVVVIGLGANQINSIETDATYNSQKATVVKMIEAARDANVRCFWVGPPDGDFKKKPVEKQDRLYKMLSHAMSDTAQYCTFISSRADQVPGGMEYPCSTDGVHFDSCSEGKIKAARWARYIYESVSKKLEQE